MPTTNTQKQLLLLRKCNPQQNKTMLAINENELQNLKMGKQSINNQEKSHKKIYSQK